MNSETGKTFIIIGGTTGLGLSAAKTLVANGHRVAILGRNSKNLDSSLKSLGNKAIGITGDATQPDGAESLLEQAIQQWGAIDGLYHVAGGSGRAKGDGPAHEISDEGLDYTLNHNLMSLILSNRTAIRQFRRQGTGGAILNMGSVLGFSPSPRHFSTHTYAAAKAALAANTATWAREFAPFGIRVGALAPGLIETPMTEGMHQQARQTLIEAIPVGRIGQPHDIWLGVKFIIENDYFTGRCIDIDGGLHML